MKILDVKQGSSEWLYARLGIPTASELDALITPLWKLRTGEGPETYLYQKLTERVLGFPQTDASSWAMEQGTILEGEAIPLYEGVFDVTVQRVGFITTDDGRFGCSPDGLIGDDNGIEVKCPQPKTHLKYLLEGGVPKDYLAQVHGAMYATGRPRWTFLSYSRQFPPLIVHVERDEAIQTAIAAALDKFKSAFDAKLTQIRAMKDADNAEKQAAYEAKGPDTSR